MFISDLVVGYHQTASGLHLCEMKRQLAEQYLSNVECVLRNAFAPLKPEDFVLSIPYKPCYRTVLKADGTVTKMPFMIREIFISEWTLSLILFFCQGEGLPLLDQ